MSREFRYRVTVDTEQIRGAARTMQRTFEQEMNRVRVQSGGTTGQAAAGGAGGALGGLGGAVVGGLAGYATIQSARMLAMEVKQWAEYADKVRFTSQAFTLLSGSSAIAASKLAAVKQASGGAIDNLQAMNIANRAGALGMADTAKELERVTRFATVAGKVLGMDTASALDNLALAASNLSFVRLDQMGVSASATRVIFNELRGELGDNKAFLEAVLQVGEKTFSSLADSALTTASGIQLITVRLQEMKIAAAGTGGWLDEDLKNMAFKLGSNQTDDLAARLQEQAGRLQDPSLLDKIMGRYQMGGKMSEDGYSPVANPEEQLAAIDQIAEAMRNLDQAVVDGVPGAQAYRAELNELARSGIQGSLSQDQISRLQIITEWWGRAAYAAGMYAAAAGNAPALPSIDPGRLSALNFQAGRIDEKDMTPEQRRIYSGGSEDPMFSDAGGGGKKIGDLLAERRKADAAAAQTTAKVWSDAGRSTADAWKSAISGIPGLPGSGRTPVTQSQMDRAAAGMPQNFADDFLRRAQDELINGVDLPDIDRGFIEKLLGMGKGLPDNILFDILSEQFQSGQLFANPFAQENVDKLINFDAVDKGVQDQKAQETGLAFVDKQMKLRFGNMDFASLGQTLSTGVAGTFSDGTVDFAGETVAAMEGQFAADKNAAALSGMGVSMAQHLFGGFTGEKGIAAQPWAAAIAASVKADITAWLEEHMGGG